MPESDLERGSHEYEGRALPALLRAWRRVPNVRAMLKVATLVTLALLGASPAFAGKASDWLHTEGGSIRLVTEAEATDGVLRGALQIVLKPGWKTYWADPGDSGIPPSVVASGPGIETPEIGFPAPRLIDDGYAPFVGYDRPVTLALSFPLPDGEIPSNFTAELFLGVCETICIPVQASLEVRDAADGLPAEELVTRAFDSLPRAADETFHARLVGMRGDRMVIEAEYPEGAKLIDLHVVSSEAYMFGTAERPDDDGALFLLPFTDTDHAPAPAEVAYTLVTDVGAVTGTLALPQ